ncbi:MAG: ABC transporter permease [Anaerolineales bacterium]|nr:MAG: ABC transporter permease [Anaerolineales bacterium]
MLSIIRLALRNILRSPLRSSLAAFAIAFGVATLIAAEEISLAVTAAINHTAESETITAFMSEQLNVGLTVVGLVVAAGAGFLLFNNYSMSVVQRQGDLGRMRAAGMTRTQLIGMLVFEALLLGVLGGALGILLGTVIGQGIIQLVQATSEIFNLFGQTRVSTLRVITSAGLGVLISVSAALSPAYRIAHLPPLEALRVSLSPETAPTRSRGPLLGLLGSFALWLYLAIAPPGRWALPETANRLTIIFVLAWIACVFAMAPGLIEVVSRGARTVLLRTTGAVGWLASDNLRRSRRRVVLAVLTLAVAVAMIVGVTGFLTYWFDELFFRTPAQSLKDRPAVGFFPIEIEAGLQAYNSVSSFTMPEGFKQKVEALVGEHATVLESYFVLAPEISFLGDSYFSYILDLEDLRAAGDLLFSFSYGDWDRAMEFAERGCVLFVTPGVAQKNNAWLGEAIPIRTPSGTLGCTIAGIGPTFVGASIIGASALTSYPMQAPISIIAFPYSPSDLRAILPELQALADASPGIWFLEVTRFTEIQQDGMKSVVIAMDGMLLLAVLSAALGVVNMTVIAILERRRELGILRAVGATREQVGWLITIEGFLVGLIGSTLGTVLGIGLVLLYVVISAGSVMGFPDFPVWSAAWSSARPALGPGLFAILTTPWLTALSARVPARKMLRGSVTETLSARSG